MYFAQDCSKVSTVAGGRLRHANANCLCMLVCFKFFLYVGGRIFLLLLILFQLEHPPATVDTLLQALATYMRSPK